MNAKTHPVAKLKPQTAAVLLIGNELLSGRTQDTNLAHIAQQLGERGIRVAEARVIADSEATIIAALNELRAKHTYVFTTGGIGPTHDDITADCVALAFGVPLLTHPEAEARLLNYWQTRDIEPNADRLRMARIPAGASLIDNPVSVAPGFRLENVVVMAGVPRIVVAMLANVLPTLPMGVVISSIAVACSLGEGTIASELRDIQTQYPNVDIGSYPGKNATGLRVTLVARGADGQQLDQVQQALWAMIERLGGEVLPE